MAPHPLDLLSLEETAIARNVVLQAHPKSVIHFREIYLQEPPKELLKKWLDAEHKRNVDADAPRPPREALCQYDVVESDRIPKFHESVVNIGNKKETSQVVVSSQHHASLTL
jgi:primary-amine oxidase